MANKRIDQPTGTETVGHEWDGIEELNTPLPRWWLWTFYLTIFWAIAYVIAYPAWPLINKGTEGMLGWTSRGQLAKELSAAEMARSGLREQIAATDIEKLVGQPELLQQAMAGGAAAFKIHCAQCHGAGGGGLPGGFPNLADDEWLWGGDLKAIEYTLTHGIRQHDDPATRQSAMPAFDGVFDQNQLNAVVDHVLSLSGKGPANAAGAEIYTTNCAVCHGPAGEGDRVQGAPTLSNAIWLYGSSRTEVANQILRPRMGVMPRWADKLDAPTIRMLAVYVHSLGGGEASPVMEAVPSTTPAAAAAED
ncbi:MAG: cytochrome-c oxidase, cbb3-type subunit III [Sphingomonadaceae bacterium]